MSGPGWFLAIAALALWAEPVLAQQPAILSEAPLTGKAVEFHAVMHPDTVYVGQQANYQVGVFLGDEVRARLRRNPEFIPPEMAGVLGYDLPVTHVVVPGDRAGRYEAHVFERAVFPLTAGVHEIPAARLSYSLPLSRSFFSREESFLLRTAPVRLVALATPAAGRPADYDGAVGTGLEIRLASDSVAAPRVGDPLLVTARVSGTGNVNLFPRPRLDIPWANVVASGERVTLDTTRRSIRGVKEFDWLLTPRRYGLQSIPVISYSYFDPDQVAYLFVTTQPETVQVAMGTLAALDSTAASVEPPLSVRERWRGPVPRPPAQAPVYWLAIALLPLPSLVMRVRRRRPRPRTVPSAARDLETFNSFLSADRPTPDDIVQGACGLRSLFLRAITERLSLTSLPSGDERTFIRALRLEGVSTPVALDAAELLSRLDRVAYDVDADRSQESIRQLTERAQAVVRSIDSEARRRTGIHSAASPRWAGTGALLMAAVAFGVASAGTASAVVAVQSSPTPTASAGALFAEGVSLYHAGNFPAAYDMFAAVTAREPRSADAWANAGTAAWAYGDSAAAAVGWQRSLRLEPSARDIRERLHLLPGEQLGGAAAVPPVSQTFLQWVALVAWGTAAALALWSVVNGGSLITAAVGSLLVIAVLGGGGAALAAERLAARDLVVVGQGVLLRDQPAVTAAARRELAAGEVARVRARAGVWTRIQLGLQVGWVERTKLYELRAD